MLETKFGKEQYRCKNKNYFAVKNKRLVLKIIEQ